MNRLRVMLVIAMLSALFCVGCGKKGEGDSAETQQEQSENDGHDHSEDDGHTH